MDGYGGGGWGGLGQDQGEMTPIAKEREKEEECGGRMRDLR